MAYYEGIVSTCDTYKHSHGQNVDRKAFKRQQTVHGEGL